MRIPARFLVSAFAVFAVLLTTAASCNNDDKKEDDLLLDDSELEVIEPLKEKEYIEEVTVLPAPRKVSRVSLEAALESRRSRRAFVDGQPLSLEDFSQMLWSMQGVTDEEAGYRTAPSAKSVYPLNVYAYVHNVNAITPGFYHYIPEGHKLGKLLDGDKREDLVKTTYNQATPGEAAVTFIITGDYELMRDKFPQGDTAEMNVHLEAGHVAQNLYLQGETLTNTGMVVMGGFDPKQLQSLFEIPNREMPIYMIPVGKRDLEAEKVAEEEEKTEETTNSETTEDTEEKTEETTNEGSTE